MNYNTNYKCIYLNEKLTTYRESYEITDENKDMIRDDLYRNDFLNVFNLDNYDQDIIEKVFDKLHDQIINCDLLKKYMCKFSCDYNMMENNTNFAIIFLFSFEHLYFFHPCICDYLKDGIISEVNLNKLKGQIPL
jgi:hypothetical protein